MKDKDYYKLIYEIADIDLEADSIADSRRILAEINEREVLLKELKKRVNTDIKNLEREYLERKHKVNVDYAGGRSPGVMSRVRGKSKIKELKKLQKKHDQSIESYHEIKYILDDLLLQIQEAKEPLNNYIKSRLGGF
jgi:methionyl-tRNA synthetase